MSKKRAIISVYDKEGVADFARNLVEKFDYEIISTGGTYDLLKENGINAIELSQFTGFRELLSGRVKSLHPAIHAGILLDRDNPNDVQELKDKDITPIDMVIVNLYPFFDASKGVQISAKNLIEYIDIGGVTLLRAAAKNYSYVTVAYKPEKYNEIINNLEENKGKTNIDLRKNLAIEAFQYTSMYDSVISEQLYTRLSDIDTSKMPTILNMNLKKIQDLRYGENPHQAAALYETTDSIKYELLNGKELSYNNLVDLTAAYNIVSEFIDVPAACIIKHSNPCGAAIGDNIIDAYLKAFECDSISAFGGIIGLNQSVTVQMANHIKQIFFEVIIAPDFEPEALEILKTKKNLRLVKMSTPAIEYKYTQKYNFKKLPFGLLTQSADVAELNKDTFKVVTETKPDERQIEDMIFAWKVAKHVNSNAIVIAKDRKTLGIGAGQTSRIASMEIALSQACEQTKDAVIASDGFYPAIDNIHAAAQSRIAAIIQPGGSIKDQDVITEANKYNIAMICTGIRHFKH